MIHKTIFYRLIFILTLAPFLLYAQETPPHPKTPMMGWSSWNNFRVDINEQVMKAQADAMVLTGLKKAGYNFINMDDGFFGGRNEKGELLVHGKRFPSGMKALADYIHSKGLKAGIYSDAGINTCASIWDKDTIGVGSGLYGHDEQDLNLMLKTWGYDFIKVDWCGGEKLALDEEMRYTQIANHIKRIKKEALFNICRWQFPGKWAIEIADSWRISGDINNKFESILNIIDKNADLWKYSSPGHVNDMDMLQVGRGMSYEEDKSHFSMWAMMNSPLLLGNDLRTISKETLTLVTNTEVIALNQDKLGYQARRLKKSGELEIWAKPLVSTMSGLVAVSLLNRSDKTASVDLDLESLGFDLSHHYTIRDLWKHQDYPATKAKTERFELPAHGVITLKIKGKLIPFNIFQSEK
ncbi:Alpha galactosidase A [Pedobacter steynii]|uniref:Alpha-galactosidase n=1 Tax=Pedobacter steynii TaxID=430522 RepID=A0A1G9Z7M2_9SPHI|nr:glycoside hydrolase family 27 protein [Pedobacter steynii]NQX39975.1 glycoside hydrolase family 27 protein [Pedobacter steynii]SDN17334.1 Alpha galactosidase A [Pedobacter steynii]